MQNQPQCYIDTDGRVACDTGGRMQNPVTASLAATPAAGRFTARPKPKPDCCVHILTSEGLEGISSENPKPGRIDCPERPEIHEADVLVVAINPDGQGGILATVMPATRPGGAAKHAIAGTIRMANAVAPMRLPVCTVGPQEEEPIPCCLVAGSNGEPLVQCDDPSHPMHGQSVSAAIARGYTLELCEPPVEVPPCCVELGDFGGKNARLVCEDTSHGAHLKPIDVEVSPDGLSAAIKIGDHRIEVPICVTDTEPEEIPCCVRDGLLECPGTPYHGMAYEQVMEQHPNVRLLPCKDVPPPTVIPQDCCVRRANGRAFLVCSGNSPWNGYELKPNEYQCNEQNGQTFCSIALPVPGQSNLFTAVFPVCDEGREPVPHDCCYDVGTGTLVCSDTSSEWHGLKVNLIDLQSGAPHSAGFALIAHPKLGSAPLKIPVCEVPVPKDCCFEPLDKPTVGSHGKLRCKGSPELDGRDGTLTDVRVMPGGVMIGVVSFLGGSSRMPLCKHPPKECPECPPPYFCCVNLDTGAFVCPANEQRHGRKANVVSVETVNGAAWAVLADGQRIPGCGTGCPAPEPCKPPGLIPTPPNGECPPEPTIPDTPPDIPGPPGPTPPPECPPGSGIPQTPPDMPGGGGPTPPPECPPGSGIPQTPPDMPGGGGPATPPSCPPNGSGIPQTPPNMPGHGPGTPTCPPNGGGIPQRPPVM